MLVLTRKIGEVILIGDDISVTVVGIEGGKIRIGIQAPPEVRIFRDEVQRRLAPEATPPRPAVTPRARRR